MKKYEAPTIEISDVLASDIITLSVGDAPSTTYDVLEW